MGISNKGKRKIIVNEKVYWWFVKEDNWGEPHAHIIADDHSYIANCNLYCPLMRIVKDNHKGKRNIPVPFELSKKYNMVFTPQYIFDLIQIGVS